MRTHPGCHIEGRDDDEVHDRDVRGSGRDDGDRAAGVDQGDDRLHGNPAEGEAYVAALITSCDVELEEELEVYLSIEEARRTARAS